MWEKTATRWHQDQSLRLKTNRNPYRAHESISTTILLILTELYAECLLFSQVCVDSPARDGNFNLSCWYRRMERVEVPDRGHRDAGDVQSIFFSFLFLNKPLSFQFSIRHYVFVLNLTRGNAAVIETRLRLDWVKAVERAGAQRVTCVTRRPAPQRPCVSSRALPEGRRPHSLTQTWAASRSTRWIVYHGSTLTQVKWRALSLSGISQRPGLRPNQHTSVLSSYQYNVVHLWYYTRNCCCSLCQPAGGDRT